MRQNSQEISATCRYRSAIMCLAFLVGFVIVFARLFFLQVIQAEQGADQVRKQHYTSMMLQANRGVIVDRSGKPLALNVDLASVFAMPNNIHDPAHVAKKLSRVLNLPALSLKKRLNKPQPFVWLKRKVGPETAEAVRALSLSGVDIVMEPRRFYPKGGLLSHLIGFAGIDSQGLEGLELQYEKYLRGQKRRVRFQRDALGRTISLVGAEGQRPSQGYRIVLTIDEVIQYIAEQELESALNQTGAQKGAVLVMDPKTGAVLAWALRPSFDPNQPPAGSAAIWRNRAITDPYEPGSTLKIIVAAAALEEGVVHPDSLIYGGEGQMPVGGTIVHDPAKSGWMTFAEVLTQSSNVGIIKTAMSVGESRLFEYLRSFGFGEKTEIDLPGESTGILRDPSVWSSRSLASMAIGQEIAVTPIQLLTALSAIANGGWLLKPYVVSEVIDSDGNLVMERTPEVKRRPISHETAQTLINLLKDVVENGTGKRAFLSGYQVAGKTGTAQKFDKTLGRYSSTKIVGSFAGFVPANDPRLAMLVIIDEPQTQKWGGVVAAPVFRKVAERVLRHLQVPPGQSNILKTISWVDNESRPLRMVQ
jgi:cell division protein FtsI (penicillin-binding protein 3)